MSSEMEGLLRAASYESENLQALEALLVQAYSAGQQSAAAAIGDVASIASEVSRLTASTDTARAAEPVPSVSRQSSSSQAQETSAAETALQTAKMITGVGPIVTGLIKLFGSSEPEPLPSLEKLVMPTAVSVEAGLSADRSYRALRYTQDGRPQLSGRSAIPGNDRENTQQSTPAASIQVNIQAMDSQSFLDRQDDIARAVREAMLHSNSLNDVVMEL